MNLFLKLGAVILLAPLTMAIAQEETDLSGSKDHPLLSRMPGFYISDYSEKDFDSYAPTYPVKEGEHWDGKFTKIYYTLKTGARKVSMVQIARNYANAIKKLGGQILSDQERVISGKIQKGGAVTYIEAAAFNDGENYHLVVVEAKPMEQEVTADAAALSQSIASSGKAAVYGVYFDTGKSIVKPESEPTLAEIVKLLNQNATLKLYVVGHTDNVGALDMNLKLSADRAEAVVKALVGRGISASRLKSAGAGPYSPETSNATEDGRAKNRRVELVAQ